MRLRLILMILLACCSVATAQQSHANQSSNEPVQAVIDDDGGRAFILNPKLRSLSELRRPSGSVISEPQQYSIFLGSDWSTLQLREREPRLQNLLSSVRTQAETDKLAGLGIKNFFGPTYSREVATEFPSGQKISDLRLRVILAEQVNAGSLGGNNPSMVYMIFLAPSLRSTLGTLTGRKHYLAYHNFLNVGGQRLHYVVVPYEPDFDTAKTIALRALVVAALDPSGGIRN